MSAIQKFHNGVTFANKKLFQGAMWLIYPLIAVIMYEVVMRYILNSPTNWVYDMTWMIFGTNAFLGFAYTLAEGGHVKTCFQHAAGQFLSSFATSCFSFL